MGTVTLAFLLAAAVAALLTPLVRHLAASRGLLDRAPACRRPEGKPLPRLGGIGIAVAFYVPLFALQAFAEKLGGGAALDRAVVLAVGGAAIIALGLYDDLFGASATEKLLAQCAIAGCLCAAGLRLAPGGAGFALWSDVLAVPATVLWIVGLTNALNLIDGLDGLAGGIALIAACVLAVAAGGRGDGTTALMMAGLGGAVLGFLVHNFRPASILMGDSGSLFLGYMLATSALGRPEQAAASGLRLAVPLLALGLPIADTALALVRRAIAGQSPFKGDRDHVHHRLLALGTGETRAVLLLYGTSVVLGAAALVVAFGDTGEGVTAMAVVLFAALAALAAMGRLGYFRSMGEQIQARFAASRRSARP